MGFKQALFENKGSFWSYCFLLKTERWRLRKRGFETVIVSLLLKELCTGSKSSIILGGLEVFFPSAWLMIDDIFGLCWSLFLVLGGRRKGSSAFQPFSNEDPVNHGGFRGWGAYSGEVEVLVASGEVFNCRRQLLPRMSWPCTWRMEIALGDAWHTLVVLATHGCKEKAKRWISERSGIPSIGRVKLGHRSGQVQFKSLSSESWASTCWVTRAFRPSVFWVLGLGKLGPKEVLLCWLYPLGLVQVWV